MFLFLFLTGLGLLGNYFYLHLFFGVDLLFGSVASCLVIGLMGTGWGVAAATIIGSGTFLAWGHPWAMLVIILEALAIGTLLKRTRGSLVLGAALFWAMAGIPLVWLFYYGVMKMDVDATWLVALKQAFNQITNALIANLILAFTPLKKRSWLPKEKLNSLFQSVFLLAAAVALIPSILVLTLNSKGATERIEEETHLRLEAVSKAFSTEIGRWQFEHIYAVQELADVAKSLGVRPSPELQRATELIKNSKQDFLNLLVGDEDGTSVAFYPSRNEEGQSTIGINFSDRAYFQETKRTLKPVVSEVLLGRGGTKVPIVLVAVPIVSETRFLGYASAALDLEHIGKMLDFEGFFLTLVDPNGVVIASNRTDVKPLDSYQSLNQDRLIVDEGRFYRNMPTTAANPMARWSDTRIGSVVTTESLNNWRLYIETPLAPHQERIYRQHIQSIAVLLGLIAAVLALSYWAASRISSPLTQLARTTTNLPIKLEEDSEPNWPASDVTEVNFLVTNFKAMTVALQRRFEELHHEIQEREKAEAELRHTSRLKDEFLATLSHELRTPLNVIMGYIELIESEGVNEDSLEWFAVISRNATHLNSLIQDLLDVSRIITGKFTLQKEPVHLPTLIGHALESVQLAADAKRIRLMTKIETEDAVVSGDASRLQQVVWNLLSNSIKFTPTGGEVEVTMHREPSHIEIQVRDTGEGIDPEFLPYVFQRFLQEDGSIRRNHGGLGLGLSIVRQIVEMHGGTVRAESRGKGKGSTMIVSLPASNV